MFWVTAYFYFLKDLFTYLISSFKFWISGINGINGILSKFTYYVYEVFYFIGVVSASFYLLVLF